MSDMKPPESTCSVCGRRRNPELHMFGSGHPVRKAEKWLKRTCKVEGKPCKFTYCAGFAIRGPVVGMD